MELNKEQVAKMKEVYAEFGIDFHTIPPALMGKVNNLVREIIKLRKK